MRLTTEQLDALHYFLREIGLDTLSKYDNPVVHVLEMGNNKHAGDDEHMFIHIEHAMDHLESNDLDEETGEPHWAHAVARLVLAIEKIVR